MSFDELFIREHRDGHFPDPVCSQCGGALPDDEAPDEHSPGTVEIDGKVFCSNRCASTYDSLQDDYHPGDDPEAIAFQSVIDGQEDDPRDIDPEDLLDDEDYGLRD